VRTAYKWLARYRTSGGVAELVDRRSVRRTQRRTLDPQQLQHAVDLRHERCTLCRVARVLAAPLSTVGRLLTAIGLGRLKNLQPAEPVRFYQWARPGDMIHADSKQLARLERVGHRITCDRSRAPTAVRVTRKPMWPSTMPRGLPTAPGLGEKPSQHLCSHQKALGRTPYEPPANPRDSSRPCWRSGRIRWPFRPKLNGTTGLSAI